MPRFHVTVRDDAGVGTQDATVNAYKRGTTTPVVATVQTDVNGDGAIGPNEAGDAAFTAAEDRDAYDLQLVNGAAKHWWNVDDEVQLKSLSVHNEDADEYAAEFVRGED